MKNNVIDYDLDYIYSELDQKQRLNNSTVLITGCAGFLGYYFMEFFAKYSEHLNLKSIIGIDNFKLGIPRWIDDLKSRHANVYIYPFDITKHDIDGIDKAKDADVIIHMASIASPTFYRKYPLETTDANVWGLRKLLDYYKDKEIKSFLFFSSSEIYGDPFSEFIPTSEDYKGNVATIGPRACYDEAKRFGETLCYLYSNAFNIPTVIVRPFNNYGPGMRLDDKRVPADFAKAVFEKRDIVLYSDGTPTRTFCYVADAILGYLKALLYGSFEYFNIGIDKPEISMRELAQIYLENAKKTFNYSGSIIFENSKDKNYLTHNPSRRCPNIDKARKLLNFNPCIEINKGVGRFLEFIRITDGVL